MTKIERTIKIEAPVEKVFDYVSNYKNWPAFYEGISDVKPITENTHSSGSKFVYKTKVMGMQFTVGAEFCDFVKNKGWTGKSFKGVPHRTLWVFKEDGTSTEFTHSVEYNLPIYYGGKLFDILLMKSAWMKTIEKSLHNLKSKMELIE